jgi:hypothetical protein
LIFVVRLFRLRIRIFLRIPWVPWCVLGSGCIVHVANRCWLATTNDTKYNGSYGTPAAFVLRETIRSWAFGCAMSDLATAEALVAT